MRSTFGILKALEFLEDVLLKTPPDVQQMIREHEDTESAHRRLRSDRHRQVNLISNEQLGEYVYDYWYKARIFSV